MIPIIDQTKEDCANQGHCFPEGATVETTCPICGIKLRDAFKVIEP